MQIGKKQYLSVSGKSEAGLQLKDESGNEIFFPNFLQIQRRKLRWGFGIHLSGRRGAKGYNGNPLLWSGEYAVLRAVQTLPSGAFMDWGIIKDLFIPYKQQKGKIIEEKDILSMFI